MTTPSASADRDERVRGVRRSILDSAAALLDEEGAEGFTIRRLALRSGCTPPVIYQHFGDKNGLLDAVLDQAFARLLERLDALPASADARAGVRDQFLEMLRFGLENPTHFRLMSAPRPDSAPPVPSAETARERLEASIGALVASGRTVTDDLDMLGQALWALLHGLTALPALRPDVEWRDGLADVAFEALLRGLSAEPPAPGGGER